MNRLALTGIAIAVSLAGCSSAPTLTPQELSAAQQSGNLEAAYEQFAAKLAGQNLNNPKGQQAQGQLAELGNQLATKLDQEVRSDINRHSSATGLVPLNVLDAQINKLPKMELWNATLHGKLASDLIVLMGKT
ncbi:MAG: hypothetical protein Q8J78_02770, partial [Moraxellaceae bacterium]|nr:hypothetical protein [Moraxellaceae bacterium]